MTIAELPSYEELKTAPGADLVPLLGYKELEAAGREVKRGAEPQEALKKAKPRRKKNSQRTAFYIELNVTIQVLFSEESNALQPF